MQAGDGPAVNAMTSTSAAGPHAAEPPTTGALTNTDPAALLQHQKSAECELAAALARFQSEVTPASEMSLAAVMEAARGAFRLGFAYTSCCNLDEQGLPLLEVTLLHRGGDQLSSQVRLQGDDPQEQFNEAARLLAQLLGIPVLLTPPQAQPSKAEPSKAKPLRAVAAALSPTGVTPVTSVTAPLQPSSAAAAVAPMPEASPAVAAAESTPAPKAVEPTEPTALPADLIGPGVPDVAGTEEALQPLGEEERQTLLEMVRSLRPVEARRQFQIAFRHHFNVPKEARSIAGFITQKRHRDFVDRFERELADLPATTTISAAVDAEAGA